jgi:hypothetical protein
MTTQVERIAGEYVCAECGGGLTTPWSPILHKTILVCGKDRSHTGYRKPDEGLDRLIQMKAGEEEIKNYLIGKECRMKTNTLLPVVQTEEQAARLVRRCWPGAPDADVTRAAIVCFKYNLDPLMKHIYLLPFKTATGYKWELVMGIRASRIITHRHTPFTYADGPRAMNEEEQKKIIGKVDESTRFWAICYLKDIKTGQSVPGYGFIDRASPIHGTDKGNSFENMAFIRAERNALDRLAPEVLPDIETVDDKFVNGTNETGQLSLEPK